MAPKNWIAAAALGSHSVSQFHSFTVSSYSVKWLALRVVTSRRRSSHASGSPSHWCVSTWMSWWTLSSTIASRSSRVTLSSTSRRTTRLRTCALFCWRHTLTTTPSRAHAPHHARRTVASATLLVAGISLALTSFPILSAGSRARTGAGGEDVVSSRTR